MKEQRKHLIFSLTLGTILVALLVGGIIAAGKKGGIKPENGGNASTVSSQVSAPSLPESSELSASSEDSAPEASFESAPPAEPSSSKESSSRDASSKDTSSKEASSQAGSSSAPASSDTSSAFVDETSGASAVILFADGKTSPLKPSQITAFMAMYQKVTMVFVRSEDTTETNQASNAGFIIHYADGRKEQFYIGQLYDDTWWSGNDFYEVDKNAYALEEYMMQFPIISDWVNRLQTP